MRCYQRTNVLDAAHQRLGWILDRFQTIVISVSGGKDSQLLFELAWRMMRERGRELHAFFIDQEAEYASTIDVIRDLMSRPGVVPHWYQVPLYMTVAVSYSMDQLYAWGPGEPWMREKDPLAIHSIDEPYPQRFYPFLEWFNRRWGADAAFLVGLRAEESLNRYRAVTRWPGIEGVPWCSKTHGQAMNFYPIYDWSFDDIWHYFWREGIHYNRIYDFMHAKDSAEQIRKYRVSYLLHEKSFRSLVSLQEFEHETYDRLVRRVPGVHTGALYAGEASVFSTLERPERFATWLEYREHLLATLPTPRVAAFRARFARQQENEHVFKQQVRQILINDWENNVPIENLKTEEREDWRKRWMEIL